VDDGFRHVFFRLGRGRGDLEFAVKIVGVGGGANREV